MEWSSSVSVWEQFSTDGSPLALWLCSSEQYSVHQFSIYRSSVRNFPEQSRTVVAFPCFTVVKSLRCWYTLLLLFFPRFSSISLHCSHVKFSFVFRITFCYSHPCIEILKSFRFESVLSQFLFFVAQIQNICSDPGSL